MTGLGEIDLYLAGEGRHERLYERLGAHCLDGDGGGVRFAVWAPNARAISVVGDWNFWSESPPTRSRGSATSSRSPASTGSRG